jgi:hypothetical protein
VYYRDKISLSPIIHHLEQAFQEVKARQIGFVKDLPVVFTEPVVNYEEFAARIGVSAEAVKAAFADEAPQGYTVMPNEVVRKDILKQIQRRIEEQMSQEGQLCLSEAVTSIEAEGVGDATSALEALGYKVVWHGINSEKAEVVKA